MAKKKESRKRTKNANPPDVVIDLTGPNAQGEEDMADTCEAGDMPSDRAGLLMAEGTGSFQSLMHEEEANAQSDTNIARHYAARKFGDEDPVEGVANSKILALS